MEKEYENINGMKPIIGNTIKNNAPLGGWGAFHVIGITDSRKQWFPPEVMEIIKAGKVFSGGKRHHEIMMDFLPENAVWIDITVPLSEVFKQYEQYDDIVVFA